MLCSIRALCKPSFIKTVSEEVEYLILIIRSTLQNLQLILLVEMAQNDNDTLNTVCLYKQTIEFSSFMFYS